MANDIIKKNRNENLKNKSLIIALILMLSTSAFAASLLAVNAQPPVQYYPTFVFAGAGPDPVGLGQQIVIVEWTAEIPPESLDDALLGSYGDRGAWTGITATITEPDGNTKTVSMPVTDPVGGTYHVFTPTKLGEHSVVVHFPAQWKNTTSYHRLYAAADSAPDTFTVVQDQVEWIPGSGLPDEYWTRPIFSYNRDWSAIAGSWLNDGMGNPYTTGPETAHIVWTKPTQLGGIVGEPFGQISYYEGTSYEQRYQNTVVVDGILIYHQPLNHRVFATGTFAAGAVEGNLLVAVDLRTGEELWTRDGVGITRAMIYQYYSPNQHGAHAFLWALAGGTAMAIDPYTGFNLFNVTNVPSGTDGVGPNGEWIRYVLGGPSDERWLALWNSTDMITMTNLSNSALAQLETNPDILTTTNAWQWRPITRGVHDGSTAYTWNVSMPAGLQGNIRFAMDDMVFGGTGYQSFGRSQPGGGFVAWGVYVEDGAANLMFDIVAQPPAANVTLQWEGTMINRDAIDAGVFLMKAKETTQWLGFDLATGQQKWISEPESSWMMYTRNVAIHDGKFYTAGYGGEIYAYDLMTGDRLWTAQIDPEGLESVYERAPLTTPTIIDGKIYVDTQEHSYTHPYYRTWKTYCFDLETGERIWDLHGSYRGGVFADGYLAALNLHDMQIYTFGKGPTVTTVSAPDVAVPAGTAVLLSGSVMDISAGVADDRIAARFPNGLPAVSDASMTAWMEYAYLQMPCPDEVEGVEVELTVRDPNGEYYVATTTSDAFGMFYHDWAPTRPGTYYVTARFKGSGGYWSSSASTAFVVGAAAPVASVVPASSSPVPTGVVPSASASAPVTAVPSDSPPPTVPPTTSEPTEVYVVAAVAAVVIVVAAVGAILLRRRAK